MKITFESYGLTASVVISSSIFESRKHQHIVDAVKLKAPEVTVTTHGLFRIRTTLTTTHLSACRVYDIWHSRNTTSVRPDPARAVFR